MLQQRLFYTNKDLKNYLFIDTHTSILIVNKNSQRIAHTYNISDKPLSDCSSYSGNNQRFKLNVESPSIPEKDIELFYCLVGRLLFTSEITRPDVQAWVTYILTMMRLPKNYCKDRHLNIDILFVRKIQMFLLLPKKY